MPNALISRLVSRIKSHPIYFTLLIIPILFIGISINQLSTTVPYMDQWELVPAFQKLDNNAFNAHDLFSQHNEHRIVVPKLIQLSLARITHWDIRAEIALNLSVALMSAVLLIRLIHKYSGIRDNKLLMCAKLVAVYWFLSPIQWENWAWGWQLEWFLSILFLLISIELAMTYRIKKSSVLLAAVIGVNTLATFTMGGGILLWILSCLLVCKESIRSSVKGVGALLVAASANLLIYTHHLRPSTLKSTPSEIIGNLGGVFELAVGYVGGVVGSHYQLAMVWGGLLIIVLLFWWTHIIKHKPKSEGWMVWGVLQAYVCMSAAMAVWARLSLGPSAGLASRYTTISVLLTISVVIVVVSSIDRIDNTIVRNKITQAFVVTTGFFLLLSYVYGIHAWQGLSHRMDVARNCSTASDNPSDDCLRLLYPDPKVVGPRLKYLKQQHYSVY
jgi:hypothetical protein